MSAGPARSKLLAIGGVATVVVLAVVGYFLFFAGGADPDPAVPPAKVVAPVAPAPADPAEDTAPTTVRLNQKNFGRDPFEARIVAAAPVTTTTSTTTGTTTDPATGTTTNPATGTTTDPATGSASGVTAPLATASHSFRVVEVAPDNSSVSVKVDGKSYNNLHAGEVFATYFKVVLISGTTNAFQYGEEKFNVLGTKRLTIA
ncbi:MAG: hypothetical protein ABIP94_00840 [Planctomycetota bacterium]